MWHWSGKISEIISLTAEQPDAWRLHSVAAVAQDNSTQMERKWNWSSEKCWHHLTCQSKLIIHFHKLGKWSNSRNFEVFHPFFNGVTSKTRRWQNSCHILNYWQASDDERAAEPPSDIFCTLFSILLFLFYCYFVFLLLFKSCSLTVSKISPSFTHSLHSVYHVVNCSIAHILNICCFCCSATLRTDIKKNTLISLPYTSPFSYFSSPFTRYSVYHVTI